ncbi:TPA: hypothetical protein HA238_06125 [Candidatus Micrarchaeota archaeon]|nr:hypothetical protein [Candidatus Micrarchaeota archaeon]
MKLLLAIIALAVVVMLLFGCIGQAGKAKGSEVSGEVKGADTTATGASSASSTLPPLELSEDELPVIEEPDFSFESTDNAITMPEN